MHTGRLYGKSESSGKYCSLDDQSVERYCPVSIGGLRDEWAEEPIKKSLPGRWLFLAYWDGGY